MLLWSRLWILEKLPWGTARMDALYGKANQYNLAVLEENAGRLRSYFGDCGDPMLVSYSQTLAEVYSYVAAGCYDNNPANGFGVAGDPVGMFVEVGLLSSFSLGTGSELRRLMKCSKLGCIVTRRYMRRLVGMFRRLLAPILASLATGSPNLEDKH